MGRSKADNEEKLKEELAELRHQLLEANETIETIRSGQIDALVVDGGNGHELYTLRTADQTYRVFIEKMTEGALTVNASGIILYCNTRFAEMVNTPLSNVIGMHFKQFIKDKHPSPAEHIFKKWDAADFKEECCLETGGGEISVLLSGTILPNENKLNIIVTDLSAQKQTQKQLEAQNKMLADINIALEASNHDLQQFASVASHDLQEPLRKIQIFANLLTTKNEDNLSPDSQKYLTKITDSAGRLKTLIVDVLNYSKLSAHDTVFELCDLNGIIEDILTDFELVIEEKSAVITTAKLPRIIANKGQIRQVFQNILSNALKFSQQGIPPVINITATTVKEKSFDSASDKDGAFLRISIKDNGIGFDEKYLSHIFALFERLHAKDKYEGTGIGLAITKKIIDKHNGIVTAKSILGKGAEFLIVIPV